MIFFQTNLKTVPRSKTEGCECCISSCLTLQDEAALTERAEDQVTEAQALKQITFPEMDSDALPSSFIPKVLACLGKWQMKMVDLKSQFVASSEASLKPFLGLIANTSCPNPS